jgi:uncharacterized membrane protein (DUF485 family)
MSQKTAEAILNDPDFKELKARKNVFSAWMTAVMLAIYFGFILLVAYGKPILGTKVYGNLTLGIPLGIGVILASWVLTGVYVLWANSTYDALVERVKDKIGG